MTAHEVVIGEVQPYSGLKALPLLAKGQREASQTTHVRPRCGVQPLNVAGRNQGRIWIAGYDLLFDAGHFWLAVAIVGRDFMAVLLDYLRVVRVRPKGLLNSTDIIAQTIRADLYAVRHALCHVRNKGVGGTAGTVATAEARHDLGIRADAAPRPDVSVLRMVAVDAVIFLLPDVSPDFVKFQPGAGKVPHRLIHHAGAALSHADAKPHDRIPVNPRHALDSADRGTLSQGRDNGDLLVGIECVCHEVNVLHNYSRVKTFCDTFLCIPLGPRLQIAEKGSPSPRGPM